MAGHWHLGDPDVLIVMDSGYDVTRLAFVLADLPVEVLGRIRSDRVLRLPKPPRLPGTIGRPLKQGPEIAFDTPATWPEPVHTTITETTRYGIATASSWDRVHPRLTHRGCWLAHDGALPVIEGTLIRLQVDHLPRDRDPKPMWLWSSATGVTAVDVDRHVVGAALDPCLGWALRSGQQAGVWGGLDPDERRALREREPRRATVPNQPLREGVPGREPSGRSTHDIRARSGPHHRVDPSEERGPRRPTMTSGGWRRPDGVAAPRECGDRESNTAVSTLARGGG
jgi:hypothetical protein